MLINWKNPAFMRVCIGFGSVMMESVYVDGI